MTDQPDHRRHALAFNAVGPAVNQAGYWLPLSARKAVAEAVLAAVADPGAGYCPHCGRGDAAPTVDQYEQQRQRAVALQVRIDAGRDWARKHLTVEQQTGLYGALRGDQPAHPTT